MDVAPVLLPSKERLLGTRGGVVIRQFGGGTMQSKPANHPGMDRYAKGVLTVIAFLLAVIALHPVIHPAVTSAQSGGYPYLYVEPGTTNLRSPDGNRRVEGKVVIDMRNGDVWGFPTASSVPYPVDTTEKEPPVSAPMYLGRFDFSKIPQ
jgi:hypothetical protein